MLVKVLVNNFVINIDLNQWLIIYDFFSCRKIWRNQRQPEQLSQFYQHVLFYFFWFQKHWLLCKENYSSKLEQNFERTANYYDSKSQNRFITNLEHFEFRSQKYFLRLRKFHYIIISVKVSVFTSFISFMP